MQPFLGTQLISFVHGCKAKGQGEFPSKITKIIFYSKHMHVPKYRTRQNILERKIKDIHQDSKEN